MIKVNGTTITEIKKTDLNTRDNRLYFINTPEINPDTKTDLLYADINNSDFYVSTYRSLGKSTAEILIRPYSSTNNEMPVTYFMLGIKLDKSAGALRNYTKDFSIKITKASGQSQYVNIRIRRSSSDGDAFWIWFGNDTAWPGASSDKILAGGLIEASKSLLRVMWFIQNNPKRDTEEVLGEKSIEEFNYCIAYTWYNATTGPWTLAYPRTQGGAISQTLAVYKTFVNGNTNAPYVDFIVPYGEFSGDTETTTLEYILGVKGRDYQTGEKQVVMNYKSDPDNYIELNVNNDLYQKPDFNMPIV